MDCLIGNVALSELFYVLLSRWPNIIRLTANLSHFSWKMRGKRPSFSPSAVFPEGPPRQPQAGDDRACTISLMCEPHRCLSRYLFFDLIRNINFSAYVRASFLAPETQRSGISVLLCTHRTVFILTGRTPEKMLLYTGAGCCIFWRPCMGDLAHGPSTDSMGTWS